MNSIFGRALIGFIVLTLGLAAMVFFAFWAINTFGGGTWWAGLIVSILALATELGIYSTTLHEPIQRWIKEPEEKNREERVWGATQRAIDERIEAHIGQYHAKDTPARLGQ